MNITISDLQNMTARQIAIFATSNAEIQETQTDTNETDEWDWENDFNYVGSRCHY